MAFGSGLDAQVGTKTESVVGTKATPVDHFWPFESAGLTLNPTYIEGSGIKAGKMYRGIGDTGISRRSAGGKIVLPLTFNKFGWWMKHLIGSALSAPVLISGTAYKQIHTPGGLKGISFTAQIGKPEPATGTVQPRTYNGCKITDWDLTIADGENSKLEMTIDAWDEDTSTALAAASYPSGNSTWNFSHCNSFKIGGTASTTGGETTIAGGTAITSVVKSLTLSGSNQMDTGRFGLGNAGIKKEQLQNDFVGLEGAFEGEYDAAFDTPFVAGTTVAFEIVSVGPQIATTGSYYTLSLIVPAAKITEAPVEVSGPDTLSVKGKFKAYDPELADGTPALQVKIISTDVTY